MRQRKAVIGLIIVALALLTSEAAMAQRRGARGGHGGHFGQGRAHFGLYVAPPIAPLWHGPSIMYRPYPPEYYFGVYPGYYPESYPPTFASRVGPPIYIERPVPAPSGSQTGVSAAPPGVWWYYCDDSKSYYPNVSQCAVPWQLVPPTPPNG